MIIKVTQTASNIKQSYEITGDDLYFQGEAGSLSPLQDITLSNQDETISGKVKTSDIDQYVYRRLFSRNKCHAPSFGIYRNNEMIGSVRLSRSSYRERFFRIELETGLKLICYIVAKNSFQYCCIYDAATEKQIALIETYLTVVDLKYTHKVYLLDEYQEIAKVLSFFTVYYSNNEFSRRFHMSAGTVYEKSWTFSKYNNKYDPSWRENNFPDEDYFGKTHF